MTVKKPLKVKLLLPMLAQLPLKSNDSCVESWNRHGTVIFEILILTSDFILGS